MKFFVKKPLKITGELNWQQKEKASFRWKSREDNFKDMCCHYYCLWLQCSHTITDLGNAQVQDKINHLMYMDDIKLFAKTWLIGDSDINDNYIQSGYRDGIWNRKMCFAKNEERKTTIDGRNRTTKFRKNQNARRKTKLTSTWKHFKCTPSKSGDEKNK